MAGIPGKQKNMKNQEEIDAGHPGGNARRVWQKWKGCRRTQLQAWNPWVQARRSTCHHHRSAWQIISRCSYRLRSIPSTVDLDGRTVGKAVTPYVNEKHEHNTEPAKEGKLMDVQIGKYKMGDFGLKLLGVDLGTPSVRKKYRDHPRQERCTWT